MLINANTCIRGEKITLVPYTKSHVPTYHGWMTSSELRELTESEPLTIEEVGIEPDRMRRRPDSLTLSLSLSHSHSLSHSRYARKEYAMCESWQKDEDKLTFIIVENASGYLDDNDDILHMVGDVNCFFNDPEDVKANVELEVMVAEVGARRRGYAKEAVSLMMGYVVRELGVKGFRAQILEKNVGSIRLFEALGFVFVKKIAVFGEVVYAIGAGDVGWGRVTDEEGRVMAYTTS